CNRSSIALAMGSGWLVLIVDVIVSLVGCLLTFSAIGFTCYEFAISLDKFHIRDGFHLVFLE
ncbi:hypothetical protein, partial [Serratia marcescens]|uniref:hypothetical protein n=1 Tax=Serratia marcescens TaxID=615 RepID=UPI0013D9B271